ncbi:hypothetical protein PFISCL1PPCAC_20950, partial [Pristionchus fissidentatus]
KRKLDVLQFTVEKLRAAAAKAAAEDVVEAVAAGAGEPPHIDKSTFCKVAGRLCVVGHSTMYHVTVAEVERRTSEPECLTRSNIGTLLKRGKIGGCSDTLALLLAEKGLESNVHKKKKLKVNTLSALLEGESIQLATDHRALIETHLRELQLARLLIRTGATPVELMATLHDAECAMSIAAELETLASEWCEGGIDVTSSPISFLQSFSLTSHGFGPEEFRTFAAFFHRFVAALEGECSNTIEEAGAQVLLGDTLPSTLLPELHYFLSKEIQAALQLQQRQGRTANFGDAPARLTLEHIKYNISVAEVQRRIATPESLNTSILVSQMRRGKTANSNGALRGEFAKHGIVVNSGKRKTERVTSFTAMLEKESLVLAADMRECISLFFPTEDAAAALIANVDCKPMSEEMEARIAQFEATSRLCTSLSRLFLTLRLPIADRLPPVLSPHAHIVYNYSAVTHGFGPDECVNWLDAFGRVCDAAKEKLTL